MDCDLGPSGTGTYARVMQFGQSSVADAYLVLYLQASSLYLFIGYWPGFELTVAAGHWKKRGKEGQGTATDDIS